LADKSFVKVKRVSLFFVQNPTIKAKFRQECQQTEEPMRYYVRSSVFGNEVLTEVNSTGKKLKTFVKANGTTLAWQAIDYTSGSPVEDIRFEHTDASGMSSLMTTKTGNGAPFNEESDADAPAQLDPMGGSVGLQNPYPDESDLPITGYCSTCDASGIPLMVNDDSPRAINGQRMKFALDDISIPWAIASSIFESEGGMMRRSEALSRQIIGHQKVVYPLNKVKERPILKTGPSTPSSQPDESWDYGTLTVTSPIYNDNWNTNSLMRPGEEQQINPFKKFASETKLSDKDCDAHLSWIFGGVAKAMEKAGDIDGNDRTPVSPSVYSHAATPITGPTIINGERNVDAGGIIHTYTDERASNRKDIPLRAPGGWKSAVPYYTGRNSGLILNYAGGVTIEFVHAGTNNANNIPSIPKNPGVGNIAEIGYVGGAGSSYGGIRKKGATPAEDIYYYHTHIVFFSNKAKNIRIDPRKLFCGW
jgi:hypothetical protein